MRNSIGGAWILGIVLTFMAIFISYIAISINYRNAFQLKTTLLNVIEEYQGLNGSSAKILTAKMQEAGYTAKGKCRSRTDVAGKIRVIGFNSEGDVKKAPEDDYNIGVAPSGTYSMCIYQDNSSTKGTYYSIEVFFSLYIPAFGDLFDFRVEGETNLISEKYDSYF